MEDKMSIAELKAILAEFQKLRREREETISYINSVTTKVDAFCEEVDALAKETEQFCKEVDAFAECF